MFEHCVCGAAAWKLSGPIPLPGVELADGAGAIVVHVQEYACRECGALHVAPAA